MKRIFLILLLLNSAPAWAATWTAIGIGAHTESTDGTPPTVTDTTTGANTIFVGVTGVPGCAPNAIHDNMNPDTVYRRIGRQDTGGGTIVDMWEASGNTLVVGSGQTFTPVRTGTCNSLNAIFVMPFSTSATGGGTNDDQISARSVGAQTALTTTAITPLHNDEVVFSVIALDNVISSLNIDSGYTLIGAEYANGFTEPGGMAYKIQTTATATSPQWTWTGTANAAALLISFNNTLPSCTGTLPNLTASTWSDIKTCYNLITNGAVMTYITVTPGSYTVTNETDTDGKLVTIYADGVNLTDAMCTTPCTIDASIITLTESPDGNVRFGGTTDAATGPHFLASSIIHTNPYGTIGIQRNTGGKPVVVQNLDAVDTSKNSVFLHTGSNQGLATGIHYVSIPAGTGGSCFTQAEFFQSQPTDNFADWMTPLSYGANDTDGDKNLYIENNTWFGGLGDLLANGRVVVRHNDITNAGVGIHGEALLNGRFIDIYDNTWHLDYSLQPNCEPANTLPDVPTAWVRIGGGTALIHGNHMPLITDPSNSSIQLKDNINITDENLRRNAGLWPCWNTLTDPGAGYPSPTQVGWGYITGGTYPGGNTVHQDSEPIYIWGNTGTGDYDVLHAGSYSIGDSVSCDRAASTFSIVNGGTGYSSGTFVPTTQVEGQIVAFTWTGSASGSGSQSSVPQFSTSGTRPYLSINTNGSGATFNVSESGGVYTVTQPTTIGSTGTEFAPGDTILIKGSSLGGSDGTNDLTITVVTTNGPAAGALLTFSSAGLANGTGSQGNMDADAIFGGGTSAANNGPSFNISESGGVYTVTFNTHGTNNQGFSPGNTLLFKGSRLGGVDGTNDLTLTVVTTDGTQVTGASLQLSTTASGAISAASVQSFSYSDERGNQTFPGAMYAPGSLLRVCRTVVSGACTDWGDAVIKITGVYLDNQTLPQTPDYILQGRDVFLNSDLSTGKPGYTPYTYPHPLSPNPCSTPDHIAFIGQPSNAALGASLGTVTVGTFDASNILCTFSTDSITLSKDGAATWGTLTSGSSATKPEIAGVATWTDLSITVTAGSGSIDAAASGVTGATSNSITISSSSPSTAGRQRIKP